MQLTQGQSFCIARQLDNPQDTGTYYVRAVVRNSVSGETIGTYNLTDKTSGRFEYLWQVPETADDTQIDITIRVYSDSGYTIEDTPYAIRKDEYIIRKNPVYFGSGGMGLTKKDIREIVKEEVDKINFPLTDLSPVLEFLAVLNRKNVDLSPIFQAISANKNEIKSEIRKIDIPKTDIRPIIDSLGKNLSAIRELDNNIKNNRNQVDEAVKNIEQISNGLDKIIEKGKDYFTDDMFELKEKIDGLEKKFDEISFVVTKPMRKKDED